MICKVLGGIFSELLNIQFRYTLKVLGLFVSDRLQDFQTPLDIILILSRRSLG